MFAGTRETQELGTDPSVVALALQPVSRRSTRPAPPGPWIVLPVPFLRPKLAPRLFCEVPWRIKWVLSRPRTQGSRGVTGRALGRQPLGWGLSSRCLTPDGAPVRLQRAGFHELIPPPLHSTLASRSPTPWDPGQAVGHAGPSYASDTLLLTDLGTRRSGGHIFTGETQGPSHIQWCLQQAPRRETPGSRCDGRVWAWHRAQRTILRTLEPAKWPCLFGAFTASPKGSTRGCLSVEASITSAYSLTLSLPPTPR